MKLRTTCLSEVRSAGKLRSHGNTIPNFSLGTEPSAVAACAGIYLLKTAENCPTLVEW